LKSSPTRPDKRTDSPKLPSTKAASTTSTPIKQEPKSTAESLKEKLKQRLSQQQQQTAKKTAAPPMPLAVRQTKRQLKEEDIRIGKNGEIKRRRFRRRNTLPGTSIPASNLFEVYKNDPTAQNNCRTMYHRSVKVKLLHTFYCADKA